MTETTQWVIQLLEGIVSTGKNKHKELIHNFLLLTRKPCFLGLVLVFVVVCLFVCWDFFNHSSAFGFNSPVVSVLDPGTG